MPLDDDIRDALELELARPGFHGVLSSSLSDLLRSVRQHDRTGGADLFDLVEVARRFAHAPVSGFAVGAVGVAASGRLVLGANIEFSDSPIAATIHAEQAVVANAVTAGVGPVVEIAVAPSPCGHCRQFLLELGDPNELIIATPEGRRTLHDLLPAAFTPLELGSEATVLRDADGPVVAVVDSGESSEDEMDRAAIEAQRRAHAPYTGAAAGVALRLADGSLVAGSTIESVAFNPTLDAMRAAVVAARFAGWPNNAICSAVESGPADPLGLGRPLIDP